MASVPVVKSEIGSLAGVAKPRQVSCASRHAAITRELTSYKKYKSWSEGQRADWLASERGAKK